MSRETAERIFEPFFTSKRTVGVGLGLSAAYGIIQKHEGTISVDTKQGEGSTFHVYLPIPQKESTTVDAQADLFGQILEAGGGSLVAEATNSNIPSSPYRSGWEK
jgi:hypothetical protein